MNIRNSLPLITCEKKREARNFNKAINYIEF